MRVTKLFRGVAVPAAALALALSPPAFGRELSGVTLPETLSAGGKTLKLNGLGLRKKAIFKVYVGGLYLENLSKDAQAILTSDEAKAVRMHFVRNVGKSALTEAFSEGFEANAKEQVAAQKAGIDRLFGMLSDVKDGDELTFAYAPGTGTTVTKGVQELGTIEGKEFAKMLFSLWLGPKPPSEDLKKGMLGG